MNKSDTTVVKKVPENLEKRNLMIPTSFALPTGKNEVGLQTAT